VDAFHGVDFVVFSTRVNPSLLPAPWLRDSVLISSRALRLLRGAEGTAQHQHGDARVSEDANGFVANAVFEIFDVNDNLVASGCATETAKRLED